MRRFDAEWDKVSLSDPNTIRGLLKFRSRFDVLLGQRKGGYNSLDSSVDCSKISEDIICIYADLDNLIKKANFNTYQMGILNKYIYGYTENDIAEEVNVETQSINKMIENICNILCDINYQDWNLGYVFWDKLNVKTNFKRCSRCGEFLPTTEEYFGWDKTISNWKSQCKKCIALSKNSWKSVKKLQ